MHAHLFNHIDILPENVNIPTGELPEEQLEEFCAEYEAKIQRYGGLDIQILGIGRTGHIGFNEPGSSRRSITRLLMLDKKTRMDAASSFFALEAVPSKAVTMGVGTILAAKKIYLLAFAEHKARIVKRAVEGPVDDEVAASFLQEHPNSVFVIDEPASFELTRNKAPWTLLGHAADVKLDWTPRLVRKAVIWLSLLLKKPILKLTGDDYCDNHLTQLLHVHGPVHKLNVRVFTELKDTITGWPGGKPGSGTDQKDHAEHIDLPGGVTTRRARQYIEEYSYINKAVNPHVDASIFPKKVLIFSPHPDDDVISMGGTMIRLIEQGHHVSVAYQTSGNIAVWDDDVNRFANFASEFAKFFKLPGAAETAALEKQVNDFIKSKTLGQSDSTTVAHIKALIRETEARNAARYCGVPNERIHFLQLPFYESGTVKKHPLSQADIDIVVKLLRELQPTQIYAAGDLSDPHGTHRVCLQAIIGALHIVKEDEWFKPVQFWLYRGAWQEWDPEDIEMAIPISPDELMQKRYAIYKHQSQKDPAPFPGSDPREFWQRTEDRNRTTAKLYDALGLPEYEAMEAFVRYDIFSENNLPL
jgi:glucosamine-6-phosphate deaminase